MIYTETGTYTYEGETVEYHYSPTIDYATQSACVIAATNAVFVNGNYIPLLKDIMFNMVLLSVFTDINVGEMDADSFTEFDKATGIVNKVKSKIVPKIVKSLEESVTSNIEYKRNTVQDDISNAIVGFVNTLTQKIDSLDDGLDKEAAMKFINKFNESNFDDESLVNAYLNSEQYKKNVAEVVDAKNAKIRELQQQLNAETAKNVVADKKPAKKTTTKSTTKTKKKADSDSKIEVVKE